MASRPMVAVVLAALLAAGTKLMGDSRANPPVAPQSCPPQGIGGDPGLNIQKNRTTAPPGLLNVTFDNIVGLNAKAVNKKLRANWTDSELQTVQSVENNKSVEVAGIVFDAKLSVAETCNCSNPASNARDFHIWIVRDQRHATTSQSFVVEMTPRVRAQHPGWTVAKLRSLIPPKRWTLVRIDGLMTYDNEHWNYVRDGVRATVWEVHPVFQFSACSVGMTCDPKRPEGWTPLDDIPEP